MLMCYETHTGSEEDARHVNVALMDIGQDEAARSSIRA